jgi:putative endonuclease
MMTRGGAVYILTNTHNNVLYTGMTEDLTDRLISHREKHDPKCFTAKYNCWKLVYYEITSSIEEAIDREKYIKGKSRQWKIRLIETMNPAWNDLGEDVLKW